MKSLAQGEEVPHVRFRKDDYWHEIAESFNQINERVVRAEEENANRNSDSSYPVAPSESSTQTSMTESETC